MNKYCKGCGVQLQTEDISKVGYIREQHLERGLCQRCFKITQYSEFQKVDIDNQKLMTLIDSYDKDSNIVTLVVDLSDFLETCLFELAASLKKYKLVVVVNKIDIILADMRRFELWESYLRDLFKEQEIPVEAIFFVSAKENLGIKRLIRYYQNLETNNIRIIGCANVGKSSLIQALFKDSGVDMKASILPTIFMTPGTTLEELEIPWEEKIIYDTPGIMKPQQLTYYLGTNKAIKEILIDKAIKPKNYQFYENQTYFIGGYAQVNVYTTKKNTLSFFFKNTLPIHRKQLVEDNTFFEKHIGNLLAPPNNAEYESNDKLKQRKIHSFNITRGKTDIVISGFGWLSIHEKNVKIEVITVEGVKVYQQNAII